MASNGVQQTTRQPQRSLRGQSLNCHHTCQTQPVNVNEPASGHTCLGCPAAIIHLQNRMASIEAELTKVRAKYEDAWDTIQSLLLLNATNANLSVNARSLGHRECESERTAVRGIARKDHVKGLLREALEMLERQPPLFSDSQQQQLKTAEGVLQAEESLIDLGFDEFDNSQSFVPTLSQPLQTSFAQTEDLDESRDNTNQEAVKNSVKVAVAIDSDSSSDSMYILRFDDRNRDCSESDVSAEDLHERDNVNQEAVKISVKAAMTVDSDSTSEDMYILRFDDRDRDCSENDEDLLQNVNSSEILEGKSTHGGTEGCESTKDRQPC